MGGSAARPICQCWPTSHRIRPRSSWHTDRLHLAELENYIGLCEEQGIITRAVRAGDLDLATPSGRMVARMLGVVARHELEHMSERRKAGKASAAAAGKWKGGRRPFGYAVTA